MAKTKLWKKNSCLALAAAMLFSLGGTNHYTAYACGGASMEEANQPLQAESQEMVQRKQKELSGSEQENGAKFSSTNENHIQMEQAFSKIPKTIEFTAKLEPGVEKRQIILGNYVSDHSSAFSVELTTDGQLRYFELTTQNGTKRVDLKTSESVCDGVWSRFTIVRDEDNGRVAIYRDGKAILEESVSLQKQTKLENEHYIGTDSRKKYFLDGTIGEICLWEDVRTEDEIAAGGNYTSHEEGMMHYWVLDNNALNVEPFVLKDQNMDGINGTAYGFFASEAPPSSVTPPFEGEGVDFSESQANIEMVYNLHKAPLTFEAWINMPESSANDRGGVICGNYYNNYYSGIPLVNFEIYENGSPRVYWKIDGTEYNCVMEGVNVARGEWVHLAMAYNLETKRMNCYVNGVLAASKPVTNGGKSLRPIPLDQPFKIGRDARPDKNLQGSIGEVRIWSTTRTSEEIKNTFDKALTGEEQGLLGCWVLQENANGVYEDRSKYKNTAKDCWMEGEISEGDFSFAVIPDTQELARSYPEKMKEMAQWLADHKETYNIELAMQVGDLVNSNSSASEWEAAAEGLSVLDGVIPYVFAPGNHDTPSDRNTSMFNTYFPYEKYSAQETFGGAFEEGKLDNSYSFFEMQGIEFMTISLETAPRVEVLEWANDVVEKYPNKKVIVTTHAYLSFDGTRTTEQTPDQPNYMGNASTGEEMWNEFVKLHENIFMVVCGHVGYPDIVTTEAYGVNGNKVQQILCDSQFMDSGSEGAGLGMIMLMTFKKGSNTVEINWYSTDRQRLFRERNQFPMKVSLYPEENPDFGELLEELEKANQDLDRLEEKLEEAQQEADQLKKVALKAQQEAERIKAEAEKAQQNSQKMQQEAQQRAAEAKSRAEEAEKAAAQAKEEYEKMQRKIQKASIKRVSIASVKSRKKRTLQVAWKKEKNISGYELQYSKNAKFKKAVKIRLKASQTSKKIKKLSSQKKYYVRIRAYKKTDAGIIYGAYSKVKQVKIR